MNNIDNMDNMDNIDNIDNTHNDHYIIQASKLEIGDNLFVNNIVGKITRKVFSHSGKHRLCGVYFDYTGIFDDLPHIEIFHCGNIVCVPIVKEKKYEFIHMSNNVVSMYDAESGEKTELIVSHKDISIIKNIRQSQTQSKTEPGCIELTVLEFRGQKRIKSCSFNRSESNES